MTNRGRAYDLAAKHIHYKAPMYQGVATDVEQALNEAEARGRRQGLEEAAELCDEADANTGGEWIAKEIRKLASAGNSISDGKGEE